MQMIVPNLYTFSGLIIGRVYLIDDADGYTLIDAGIPQAAPRILDQLRASGRDPKDVKRVLITHAHPDHIGGLPKLVEATGAAVITSAIEKPFLEGTQPLAKPKPSALAPHMALIASLGAGKQPSVPVSRTLEDWELLPDVFGGLRAVHTPGHSPGHTAYWQPEKRVLFVGDVMSVFVRNRPTLPFPAYTTDMAQNIRSLGRIANLDVEVACFGHGRPVTDDARHVIRKLAVDVKAPLSTEA